MTAPAINAVARLVKVNSYINKVMGGYQVLTVIPCSLALVSGIPIQLMTVTTNKSVLFQTNLSIVLMLLTALGSGRLVSSSEGCQDLRRLLGNEFGYFQSTTYNGAFGGDVPINYYYNLCSDVYGDKFTVDYIRERVQASVDHYGLSTEYNATNIVIPNGSLDPWHALGTYAQNNPTAIPYLIQGTAHCADMEPPGKDDPQSLKDVRDVIFSNLKKWTSASAKTPESRVDSTEHQKRPRARRAKYFPTEICWGCGKPKNEHLRHRKPPAELAAKFEKRTLAGRPVSGGFLGRLNRKRSERLERDQVTTNYITQPIDHFNFSDTRTYQQLFYANDKYYKTGGPVFLVISGEAAADEYWISEKLPLTGYF